MPTTWPFQYPFDRDNLPAFGDDFLRPAVPQSFSREKLHFDSLKADDLFEETLAAQTIRKAAQPSEANHFERRFPWEVAQTLLPKAGSLQRHLAKDCQVFRLMHDLQLPTKEETA